MIFIKNKDIHTAEDWDTIFLLLKTAGAALVLEKKVEENEEGEDIPLQNSRSASENDLSQRHWIRIE